MGRAAATKSKNGTPQGDLMTVQGFAGGVKAGPEPYRVQFTLQGTSQLLMHAYKPEAVEKKSKAGKGSREKKEDDPEDFVYRDKNGLIALPGRNVHAALIEQARSHQDPRSPRKSARDLMKCAIYSEDQLIPFGPGKRKNWDLLDYQRVCLNGKSAVTRCRPAFNEGWTLTARFTVLLPEYVEAGWLCRLLTDAGKFQGLGDYRPTFGRFVCTNFEVLK